MKYRTFLMFGAPGAGKGTQGRILGTVPHFYHCACGDVFRRINHTSELGRIFLEHSSKGQLVPDEYTVRLWRESIENEIRIGRFHPETDTLVLDGIPRNRSQAEMLQDYLHVAAIFLLQCPDTDRLVERMQRRALKDNRLDDANIDVIRHRFEVYERDTRQVLDCYPTALIHHIDATQPPVNVLRDILGVIVKL
jgi:adenylate kinase